MRQKRDQGRVEWFSRRARELAFPGLASGGGSGTSTPLPVEKAEVVADVMEQLDTTADQNEPEGEPKLTRRQARSREGRKELAKFKTEKPQPKKVAAPVTPVVTESGEKRRKVKVPYVEDAAPGSPTLDLIVNASGDVLLVSFAWRTTTLRSVCSFISC